MKKRLALALGLLASCGSPGAPSKSPAPDAGASIADAGCPAAGPSVVDPCGRCTVERCCNVVDQCPAPCSPQALDQRLAACRASTCPGACP